MEHSNFVDIAPRGRAEQSSRAKAGGPKTAQDAVGGDLKSEFAFHTEQEDAPWWSLDLGEEWPAQRIVLHNRRNAAFWHRAREIRVEVSRNGTDWLTLHDGFVPFGGAGVGAPLMLPLNGRVLFRHLRLSLPKGGILHLAGVQVLVKPGLAACRAFEAAHGLNLTRHVEGADPVNFVVPYDVIGDIPDEPDGKLTGISLRRYGRFGNNVIQTLYAIRFAEVFGLGTIRLCSLPGLDIASAVVRDGMTLLPPKAHLPGGEAFLDGDFFENRRLVPILGAFDKAARYRLARDRLRPLLRFPDVREPPAPDELVIHLRSGDIFSGTPHPLYRQPPLSFYTTVVDHLRTRGVRRVCLVYEDRANPCIPALEEWLDAMGLPRRSQSGTVEEDIAFLLQARHAVYGPGTFGYGVCILAGEIESVHVFDGWGLYDGLPNIASLRLASDAGGGYIPANGWQNTEKQRALMLAYPADQLAFREG